MRQVKALCIVVALVCVVPAVDICLQQGGARQFSEPRGIGIDAFALAGLGDVDSFIAHVESLANREDPVPAWFEREIGFMPSARDIRMSGSVVGYVVDGDGGVVMKALEQQMADRGWACVPLGGVEGATFVKSSGACTWTLVTCTQVGQTVSVVVRCNIA